MRRFSKLILVGLLVLGGDCSPHAAPQRPSRDAHSLQMLQTALAQLGGPQKAAIRDIKIEGTLSAPAKPDIAIGSFVAKGRGDDFTFETHRQDGTTTSYKVLNSRGSFRAGDKTNSLQPFNTSGLGLDVFPLLSRWTDFALTDSKVEPAGTVLINDVPHVLVRVAVEPRERDKGQMASNNHNEFDVILDSTSGLIAAIRFKGSFGPYSNDRLDIENRFSHYRTVNGLIMPTRITRVTNRRPMIVLTITSVRTNNGFSDSDFEN